MSQDERVWLSQQVIFHRDSEYGTQTNLEIAYSSQTSDFQSYGAPFLNIILSSTNPVYIRKSISLSYQNASDLLLALKYLFDSFQKGYPMQRGAFELVRKYHKDRVIKFDFFLYANSDKVCSISIHNTATDFLSVVVSFDLFRCVCNIVKDFVSNYFSLVNNILTLSNNHLLFKILQADNNSNNILKSLNVGNSFEVKNEKEEITTDVLEATEKINELDQFLGQDMQNIVVPEITQTPTTIEKQKTDHSNSLVNAVFKNNLKILEDLVTSSFTSLDPIAAIFERLIKELDYPDNFSFTPGMSDDESKSYHFLSKLLYLHKLHQFSLGKQGVPELKLLVYKPTNPDSRNFLVAYDLFVIFIYLRIFIAKLSRREPNVYKNKIVFYTGFRYIFDMLSISFIHSADINKVKSCIIERFDSYNTSGFFNEYTGILASFSIPAITMKEFSDLSDQILVKLSENPLKLINDLHNELYEKGKEIEGVDLRIPFSNTLNLEQILKVLQIQLTYSLGQFNDVKDDKVLLAEKINSVAGIDDPNLLQEIVSLFYDKKVDVEKKAKEKETNLLRACKFHISDVPVNLQNDFLQYVSSITIEKYDWDKFSLEEFKDNIIKVLYIWNENDSKILYSDFMSKVENCMMTKDLILVKNKMLDSNDQVEDTNFDLSSYSY